MTREEKIYEDLKNNTLELDDSFSFRCRGCGKCCKNRDDIMLTTRDLFNASKKLVMTPLDFIEKYCDTYIGRSSRIPIVKLASVGASRSCPLLQDKRCSVHDVKPVVCALYPLGRYMANPVEDGASDFKRIEPRYMLQGTSCGAGRRTQTVRQWLERYNIPINDVFYSEWNHLIISASGFIRDMEQNNVNKQLIEDTWNLLYVKMYLDYDSMQEFMPQFEKNASKLLAFFEQVGVPGDDTGATGEEV